MTALTPITLSSNGLGAALACNDASGSTRVALVGDGDALVVTNIGDYVGYLAVGDDTVTAIASGSTASLPILPGHQDDQIGAKLTDGSAITHVAGVCASGQTTTLIVHRVQR